MYRTMKTTSNPAWVKVLLLLQSIPGLGCSKINQLIKNFENIFDIFECSDDVLLQLGLNFKQIKAILKPNWSYSASQIKLANKHQVEMISIYDESYPFLLKQIYDPPPILYVKGNKKLLNHDQIAVVGTRKPTVYGCQTADYFSNELLNHGYVITSGYALGIDIIAHLAAAKRGLPTVVVFGTSLDYVYPARHNKYFNQIIGAGGVFISEFGFTTLPHPSCFPRRNRIISGLSRGVLVIEAARKSGSLITARCALEQGREIFAVPGNINNQQALGCLDLISNGAKLTIDSTSIIEELDGFKLGMKIKNQHKQFDLFTAESLVACVPSNTDLARDDRTLDNNKQKLMQALAGGVADFDSLVCNSQLPAQAVATELVQLEILGYISSVPGGYSKVG